MIAFTKATAREMARRQVNANCVCPGPTDLANMVAFFTCDEASYITGQTVSVSGGLTTS